MLLNISDGHTAAVVAHSLGQPGKMMSPAQTSTPSRAFSAVLLATLLALAVSARVPAFWEDSLPSDVLAAGNGTPLSNRLAKTASRCACQYGY